jgi:hypothetical protein
MAPQQYVADIKAKLVASAAVATITIVEERLLPDRGYFRARLTLSNSDHHGNRGQALAQGREGASGVRKQKGQGGRSWPWRGSKLDDHQGLAQPKSS